jgi:hypothetical protein
MAERICGYSSMVECVLAKHEVRVRFPLPAPSSWETKSCHTTAKVSSGAASLLADRRGCGKDPRLARDHQRELTRICRFESCRVQLDLWRNWKTHLPEKQTTAIQLSHLERGRTFQGAFGGWPPNCSTPETRFRKEASLDVHKFFGVQLPGAPPSRPTGDRFPTSI